MSAFLRSPGKKADADAENPHRRVVLLLDMDCFYAQCEIVRLGLDQSIPLALVQWSAALAVNYPARKFGIKRGDSFDVIREKSHGQCVAIHLPVTPVDEDLSARKASPRKEGTKGDGGTMPSPQREGVASPLHDVEEIESSQSAYDEEFNQPKEVREEMYKMEKNRMRSPTEGKACLDRYRLASARIFSLIDETLAECLGRKNYILERASIDELFIDVTAFCYQSEQSEQVDKDQDAKEEELDATGSFRLNSERDSVQSLEETVICHETSVDLLDKNDEIGRALRLGCHAALTARRAVFQKLGFTLSAGISTSKLVSKLAASYGKPNGQAVIYPGAMTKVMEETQLRKARMLGGKLGKKVSSLLPESETTMGSICRLLPLDTLVKAIGEESGRWVFDACRGIDHEEVRATLKVLPKSITAFKSFPTLSYPELEKWTALLARDIMKRVELDNARNSRIPKSVSVGYTMKPGGAAWIGQTFRMPFPSDRDFDARVQKLVDTCRRVLTERGHSSVIRIGFSAIDFIDRPKVGIDSFFSKTGKGQSTTTTTTKRLSDNNDGKKEVVRAKPGGIQSFLSAKKSSSSPKPNGESLSPKQKGSSPALASRKKAKGTGLTSWLADDATKSNSPKRVAEKDAQGVGLTRCLGDAPEKTAKRTGLASWLADEAPKSNSPLPETTTMTDEEMARQLQASYDEEVRECGAGAGTAATAPDSAVDKDEAFALQLQSTYDREHSVLSHAEKFSGKRKGNSTAIAKPQNSKAKRSKMDFFLKK